MREFLLFIILLTLTMGSKAELLDPSKETMRVLMEYCSSSETAAKQCNDFYEDAFKKLDSYTKDESIRPDLIKAFRQDITMLGFPSNHPYQKIEQVCFNNHSGALYSENFSAMVNAGLDRGMTAIGFIRMLFIVTFECRNV